MRAWCTRAWFFRNSIEGRRMPVRSAPLLPSEDTAHVLGELLGIEARTIEDLMQGGML
jgi:hypothetical protein